MPGPGTEPRPGGWETLLYVIPSFTFLHKHTATRVTKIEYLTFIDFHHVNNMWRAAQIMQLVTTQFSAGLLQHAAPPCTATSPQPFQTSHFGGRPPRSVFYLPFVVT
jgi:hypothetical protein